MFRNAKWIKQLLLMTLGFIFLFGPTVGASEVTTNYESKELVQENWQPLGYGLGREFAGSMHATIAKALNMTEEEVYIAKLKGKSIAELAKQKGVSLDTLVTKMMETRKVQIDQWVKEKKLTEAEAKTILERMEKNMRASIERKGVGPRGDGRGYGQGRWR